MMHMLRPVCLSTRSRRNVAYVQDLIPVPAKDETIFFFLVLLTPKEHIAVPVIAPRAAGYLYITVVNLRT